MSEYENGYRAGYVDAQLEKLGVDALPERAMSEAQLVARDVASGLGSEAISDYWLGYYHGRYYGRTGRQAAGSEQRGAPPELPRHTCLRCGHTWLPRTTGRPLTCAKCRSPYWDKPRRGHA